MNKVAAVSDSVAVIQVVAGWDILGVAFYYGE